MQQTEHYQLNQWDPTDRILRADFNADNAKLDAALAALSSGVSQKAGPCELIKRYSSEPGTVSGTSFSSFPKDWESWNYVFMVTHYSGTAPGDHPLILTLHATNSRQHPITGLSTPGHVTVFLSRHDKSAPVEGFTIGQYLVPFRCAFSYEDFTGLAFSTGDYQNIVRPDLTFFGAH